MLDGHTGVCKNNMEYKLNGYHKLNLVEINELKSKLILPSEIFPHYLPITVDKDKEEFRKIEIMRRDGKKELLISNYGQVKYNNVIVEPYFVGTFLHCSKVYSKGFGDYCVYNLVKEAFDPIQDRYKYQIHHINNNALDNRPENLIYVTEGEHRKIDEEFNKQLIEISKKIYKENEKQIISFFQNNSDRSIEGSELKDYFNNVFKDVIKNNVIGLCNKNTLLCIELNNAFEECKYILNESQKNV